jgi:Protein of unknown function (DUF3102)
MIDVIHLSTDALVKAINDEYALILVSERSNLAKALAIGEKLVALKSRIEHGEWKLYLKKHCEISYETAAVYCRLHSRQADWRKAAADKNVDPASLTIEAVLKLLAPPRPDTSDKGKSSKAAKAAVEEPGNEPSGVSLPPDEVVMNLELDYGDMFETLKCKYDQDDLLELTKLLAANLGMVLMPISQSKALMEAIGTEASPM